MHSIKTKIIILTICATLIAMTVATAMGAATIKKIGDNDSSEMLLMLCQTGEKNLDSYFDSVEQAVDMVSSFLESDLNGIKKLNDEELAAHIDRVRDVAGDVVYKTNGVLTYYYRIDPTVSETEKGWWYVNLDGNGFTEHEPTDITLYDTEDTSKLVWFTVPKATGSSIWIPPYITDNLDVRVLSYNVPVYRKDKFIGVFGIEIDYSTMAKQVDNIKLYKNGYAFINDDEGNIIYHPRIDVTSMPEEERPKAPPGILSENEIIEYEYEGVAKKAAWETLSNGMRLNVTVPVSEVNAELRHLLIEMLLLLIVILVVFAMLTSQLARHITKPLEDLTEAAEQVDSGNYDVKLDYKGHDEVGILTRTFSQLISHLKIYISDLNSLAYADALTSVRNKGAFDIYVKKLQAELDDYSGNHEFAIAFFDCDDLKEINDKYGHDKGNLYLKNTCKLICEVFRHSPVFRLGGDEFAAIMQNEDYRDKLELMRQFEQKSADTCVMNKDPWDQVRAAMGIAVYDSRIDISAEDVVRRADKLMYDNKREHKKS